MRKSRGGIFSPSQDSAWHGQSAPSTHRQICSERPGVQAGILVLCGVFPHVARLVTLTQESSDPKDSSFQDFLGNQWWNGRSLSNCLPRQTALPAKLQSWLARPRRLSERGRQTCVNNFLGIIYRDETQVRSSPILVWSQSTEEKNVVPSYQDACGKSPGFRLVGPCKGHVWQKRHH